MTPKEAAQEATRTSYRFQVGPHVFEHDPITGKTHKVQTLPLLKDGKTWTKTQEGWVRK